MEFDAIQYVYERFPDSEIHSKTIASSVFPSATYLLFLFSVIISLLSVPNRKHRRETAYSYIYSY